MKSIMFNKFLNWALLFVAAMVVVTCTTEETPVPLPVADFTVSITGTTASFSNTSTNGESYSWDFGDGSAASTEEAPSHDYGKFGAYVVKLTATNASGTDDKSVVLQVVVQITIDGDFSDWNDLPALSTRADGNTGIISTVKAASDLNNIYFYIEGDATFYGFVQLYLNADGDATTGWSPAEHPVAGADYELDAGPYDGADVVELWPWVNDATNNPDRLDWFFEGEVIDDPTLYIKPIKTGNALEFALVRAKIPGLADKISFALGDVLRNPIEAEDWVEHGYLPNADENYIELELFK